MSAAPPPFDAVLFDLDGTLLATERYWPQAARVGARRAFDALGLEREPPAADVLRAAVGMPGPEVYPFLFPDLAEDARALVQAECEAEERRLMSSGLAAPMPGALDVLDRLRRDGCRIGVASNCGRGYLDAGLGSTPLGARVDVAYCLDSPGIASKADMLAALLDDFGTRSAVMVGDRAVDLLAARANGLPHVHCAFGFAPPDEAVDADACISDLGELPGVLARRTAWIEDVLGRLPAEALAGGALGVTGGPLCGKSLFARDLVRRLEARGAPAALVELDAFARPSPDRGPRAAGDPLAARHDLEALARELLEPHARGEAVATPRARVGAGATLVLAGPFLDDARVAPALAATVRLTVPEDVALARAAARELRGDRLGAVERARERLELEAAHAARPAGAGAPALELDATRPLGPRA